jgi:hypothetical protein
MNRTLAALLAIVIVLAVLGGGYYLYTHRVPAPAGEPGAPVTPDQNGMATTTATTSQAGPTEVIGHSAGNRDIVAYHYGTGTDEILFVGGIHGGYEANTSLLAYELTDWLDDHRADLPGNERITVIPVVNPDGIAKVTGNSGGRFAAADIKAGTDTVPGRFNDNDVDLNRNFDCDWQAEGVWQTKTVSGGTAAFSEPETQAIRSYVQAHSPRAVVVYYSAAGGVYASNCHSGVPAETETLTDLYAKASGYPAHESFDFYATTGDMVNWLAKQGVPGISVLLTNHTDVEWDKNLKGIQAVIDRYAK